MGIRVYIVDDHAIVRTGLRLTFKETQDIEVIGEAESGEAAMPEIRRLKPDVVLCDLHLPGISGLEVTERIAHGSTGARVIVLTVMADGPMPRRLLEAGAFGYVGKACESEELLHAVREVAHGRKYLANIIAQGMALAGISGTQASPFDALTPREMEVALLLNQGLRQEAIAKHLCLSAKTVNTHKSRLFEKLAVRDNIALARLISQYGLVDAAHAVH